MTSSPCAKAAGAIVATAAALTLMALPALAIDKPSGEPATRAVSSIDWAAATSAFHEASADDRTLTAAFLATEPDGFDDMAMAVMGLGAVISSAGLGEAVVGAITGTVAFAVEWPVWNTSILIGLSTLVAMITNLPGVPAVMTPLAGELSDATGLPLETVLMTQVVAFSNVFLPFQAPPLIAAIQAGNLPAGAVIRLCLSLFLISLLLLAPLDLLWWHLLGMF